MFKKTLITIFVLALLTTIANNVFAGMDFSNYGNVYIGYFPTHYYDNFEISSIEELLLSQTTISIYNIAQQEVASGTAYVFYDNIRGYYVGKYSINWHAPYGAYVMKIKTNINNSYVTIKDVPTYEKAFSIYSGGPQYLQWNFSYKDESNAYHHATIAHDFFKYLGQSTVSHDRSIYLGHDVKKQVQSYVYAGSTVGSNTTFDGTTIKMSFGSKDGKYWTRESDIVYREYTKAVIFNIYENKDGIGTEAENDAMEEGLSDYFACSITNDYWLGEAVITGRKLDNSLLYDYIYTTNKYEGGRVIGGACWDMRKNIGDVNIANSLVLEALKAKSPSFIHLLDDIIELDDYWYGDNNISNGTPHGKAIAQAFHKHGIYSDNSTLIIPTAPAGVEAELRIFNKDGIYTGDGVRIKWKTNPEPNIYSYKIFRNWNPYETSFLYYNEIQHDNVLSMQTYVDTYVQSSKTYGYQIIAKNSLSNSSNSSNTAWITIPSSSGGGKFIVAGLPQPSEYLIQREGYYQYGDSPEETIDYHPEQLIYKVHGLDKDKKYRIAFDYNGGGDDSRTQTASIDGIPMHPNYKVPKGFDFSTHTIPKGTYNKDGEIEITITKVEGPDAVIADIIIWEDELSNNNNPNPIITKSLPKDLFLSQNFPNPFNPETTIEYTLPKSEMVSLSIYNTQGQLVRILVNKNKPAGYHSVHWNGTDDKGNKVASGIYFYTIKAGSSFSQTRKMLLIK